MIAWSIFLGKPSMRNLPVLPDQPGVPARCSMAAAIAISKRRIVISIGTIVPSLM